MHGGLGKLNERTHSIFNPSRNGSSKSFDNSESGIECCVSEWTVNVSPIQMNEDDVTILTGSLKKPTFAVSEKKAKTYVEHLAKPFLPKFRWENKTLEKDMRLFWMSCHRFYKARPTQFSELLAWAAKNNLHPLAFVKAVNTLLKK